MTTFKEFIAEGSDENFHLKTVEAKKAIAVLNSRCKNALWMLEKDKPIWRGEGQMSELGKVSSFAIIDPSKTVRYSENTSNWYTEIFDSSPYMKDFPKRSRSLICTFDSSYAQDYAWNEPYVIIPFDNVKVGVCPGGDMWETKIRFPYSTSTDDTTVESYNDHLEELAKILKIPYAKIHLLESLKKIDKKLKSLSSLDDLFDKNKIDFFRGYFGNCEKDFLNTVYEAYKPSRTKLTVHTTSSLYSIVKGSKQPEVWVGGPSIVIEYDTWQAMRKAYKTLKKQNANL